MAFVKQQWANWTGASGTGYFPVAYTYWNADDNFATVTASAYFNSLDGDLYKDDLIYIVASDKAQWVRISSAHDVTPVTVVTLNTGVVPADLELAEGSIFVGNAAGEAAALDAKGDAKLLLGNATTVTSVAMSGDVTITNAGVTAIGAGKVLTAMLADNAVTTAKITDANVTNGKLAADAVTLNKLDATTIPGYIVYQAIHTTVGGAATEVITAAGVLATDAVNVTLHTAGAVPRTVTSAATGGGNISVVFSGDPAADHKVNITVVRAVP